MPSEEPITVEWWRDSISETISVRGMDIKPAKYTEARRKQLPGYRYFWLAFKGHDHIAIIGSCRVRTGIPEEAIVAIGNARLVEIPEP